MEVALMVPCYIDSFYPKVGVATLELLERLKIDVTYPTEQTCCGQPMANSAATTKRRAPRRTSSGYLGSSNTS